ncbi:MAG: hypothetical protein HYX63_17180 [Gammaproteobacteria bacterium]|nr:hypothetical protein [Gammaproteobacteria bacterium]
MNNANLAAFAAAYVVIALLLLNVLIFTRWMWWVKLAAVILVAGLCTITYRSIPDLLGWPTARGLPARFNLMGLQIVEPDKGGTTKGNIFLWVTEMNLDGSPRVPRAFVLPFHPELQVKVAAAGTKLRKNLPQLGEISTKPFESAATDTGHNSKMINLDFFDLPDPLFPER